MRFSPLDSEIAHLEVLSDHGEIVLATREIAGGGPHLHHLGPWHAPRYRLEEPWSDDAWRVDVLPGGQGVRGAVTEDVEWEYLQWAEGSAAENGASLLGALPAGGYLLVRSSRTPHRSSRILLGNELVERPPNAATLLDAAPHYAAWFGPIPHLQPATAWPLVGIAVLDCTWNSGLDEVLFFDCSPEPEDASTSPTSDVRNPVLVLPVRGPLVLHGCGFDDMRAGLEKDRRRWEERDALLFARALARWSP